MGADRSVYCGRWNYILHRPVGRHYTEDRARACHETGIGYSVALLGPRTDGVPDSVIEINTATGCYLVWFFDDHGRREYCYYFDKASGDLLFMKEMITYSYPNDRAEDISGASSIRRTEFSEDGIVRDTLDDYEDGSRETTSYDNVDVSVFWEPIPDFGHRGSIARWNRG